jgi:hypothetical protein
MLDKSRTIPRFVFLLQPEFPINAFVLATEALRIVNQNSGRMLVSAVTVSEDGRDVRASNGMWIKPDESLATMPAAEVVLVFEGNLPVQRNTSRLLSALWWLASTPVLSPWPRPAFSTTAAPPSIGRLPRPFASASPGEPPSTVCSWRARASPPVPAASPPSISC